MYDDTDNINKTNKTGVTVRDNGEEDRWRPQFLEVSQDVYNVFTFANKDGDHKSTQIIHNITKNKAYLWKPEFTSGEERDIPYIELGGSEALRIPKIEVIFKNRQGFIDNPVTRKDVWLRINKEELENLAGYNPVIVFCRRTRRCISQKNNKVSASKNGWSNDPLLTDQVNIGHFPRYINFRGGFIFKTPDVLTNEPFQPTRLLDGAVFNLKRFVEPFMTYNNNPNISTGRYLYLQGSKGCNRKQLPLDSQNKPKINACVFAKFGFRVRVDNPDFIKLLENDPVHLNNKNIVCWKDSATGMVYNRYLYGEVTPVMLGVMYKSLLSEELNFSGTLV